MVTIRFEVIKRMQTRSVQYSHKKVKQILNQLGWKNEIVPPATMIIQVEKVFDTAEQSIQGRRELELQLRRIKASYRVEIVLNTEDLRISPFCNLGTTSTH